MSINQIITKALEENYSVEAVINPDFADQYLVSNEQSTFLITIEEINK